MAQYLEKEDSNREVLNADPNEIRRLRRQAKKEIENSQKNEKGGNKPVMGKPQKKVASAIPKNRHKLKTENNNI